MMNFLPWRKKEETVTDRKYRLAEELAALPDEDAREVVKFAKPGWHIARNGGPRGKKEEVVTRQDMIEEAHNAD